MTLQLSNVFLLCRFPLFPLLAILQAGVIWFWQQGWVVVCVCVCSILDSRWFRWLVKDGWAAECVVEMLIFNSHHAKPLLQTNYRSFTKHCPVRVQGVFSELSRWRRSRFSEPLWGCTWALAQPTLPMLSCQPTLSWFTHMTWVWYLNALTGVVVPRIMEFWMTVIGQPNDRSNRLNCKNNKKLRKGGVT